MGIVVVAIGHDNREKDDVGEDLLDEALRDNKPIAALDTYGWEWCPQGAIGGGVEGGH